MRRTIFETLTGSHLYGTNRPDSDLDYTGVFMPTRNDICGLLGYPQEMKLGEKLSDGPRNTKGDTDRKLYSLPKFLKLAAEGQSGILEMLYSPVDCWITETDEWYQIWSEAQDRQTFLSQNSIVPFIGFATAQAHKATLKGGNLNHVRELIKVIESNHQKSSVNTIEDQTYWNDDLHRWHFIDDTEVDVVEVEYRPGVKMNCIEVAGKKFEFTQSIKHMYKKLKEIESRYGSRSVLAASLGQDFKSLMHAYRLIYEAEDILKEGKLILPFNKKRVKFLLSVRSGDYITDYYKEIEERIQEVKNIKSDLPAKVNLAKINALCDEIIWNNISKGN